MKEGRSATKLSVLCAHHERAHIEEVLLRHTSAIGCRRSRWERAVLPRRLLSVETPLGSCQVKVTKPPHAHDVSEWRVKVEHREARALAIQHRRSLAEVERVVLDEAYARLRAPESTWDQLSVEGPLVSERGDRRGGPQT